VEASLKHRSGMVLALRWLARLGSLASLGVIAAFLMGEWGVPTASQWVAMAFFPLGVCAGMVIGWWRPVAGGAVTVLSLGAFYAWMFARSGHFPGGPYFLILALPGAVFLASGLAEQCGRGRRELA
jgi:hypothetical protein